MTKAHALVLDGGEVKFRLEEERRISSSLVHIDWLRFTVFLRNVVPTFQSLPDWSPSAGSKWERHLASVEFGTPAYELLSAEAQARVIRGTVEGFDQERHDPQFQAASTEAYDLAREVSQALGSEFKVNTTLKPGQDFYKYRFSIERDGYECAWVGFLAAGNGKAKGSQDQSIHVNLQGHACTFAAPGWREKMVKIIELHGGRITRCDLALDMFNGLGYDFAQLLEDYRAGVFKVRGKSPACKLDGDWANGHGRSIYVGSRTSGKITNIYEKGDALFGITAQSKWVRAELRYGDQLRVLPVDILTNPDTYFGGASDWHEALLIQAGASVIPQAIKCDPKLPQQTVAAEVYRNVKWLMGSAAATVRGALRFMDLDEFLELVHPEFNKLPGRLEKFTHFELQSGFDAFRDSLKAVGGCTASPFSTV